MIALVHREKPGKFGEYNEESLEDRRMTRMKSVEEIADWVLRYKWCNVGDEIRISWFSRMRDDEPQHVEYHVLSDADFIAR